jgi:hypothetical protein
MTSFNTGLINVVQFLSYVSVPFETHDRTVADICYSPCHNDYSLYVKLCIINDLKIQPNKLTTKHSV